MRRPQKKKPHCHSSAAWVFKAQQGSEVFSGTDHTLSVWECQRFRNRHLMWRWKWAWKHSIQSEIRRFRLRHLATSPPQILEAYYVMNPAKVWAQKLCDCLCLSKGLDIYLSNSGQKLSNTSGLWADCYPAVARWHNLAGSCVLSNGQRICPSRYSLTPSSKRM